MKTAKTVILILLLIPLALLGMVAIHDLWYRLGPAQNE